MFNCYLCSLSLELFKHYCGTHLCKSYASLQELATTVKKDILKFKC